MSILKNLIFNPLSYFQNDNDDKNINKILLKAENGNSNAQLLLSKMYLKEENLEKSLYWLEKSIDQNNPYAQYFLGEILYFGYIISQFFSDAKFWFEKAAKQNNSGSQYFLGKIYYEGNCGDKNYEKAKYWLEKAVEQNDEEAQLLLDLLIKRI